MTKVMEVVVEKFAETDGDDIMLCSAVRYALRGFLVGGDGPRADWTPEEVRERVLGESCGLVVVILDGESLDQIGPKCYAAIEAAQRGERPFAEPVPVEMYRMSDDAKTPNLRLILSVEPGEVVLYEADMTSRSATAKETAVHDKIIMSPADARWLRDALQQADLSDPPEVTR